MELILAKKILDLDIFELHLILQKLKQEDNEAYELLNELVED